MPKTYNKVLDAQVRAEAAAALQKVFNKSKKTLDEQLKDPNSIESKALATMIVVIMASQWLEVLITKAAAELHYVEKMLQKDAAPSLTMQRSSSEDDLEEEAANQDQQPRLTALQDMLTNVKTQLIEFRQQRADLEEQYQEAVEQLKETQEQQLNDAFAKFDMTATPEQIQQVRQLVTQQADEGFLNKLAIDSYEKMQQEHNQGPSILRRPGVPPPPPPPLAVVKERVVRGYDVAIEVASVASLMAIHRSNHELGDSIRMALKAFPIIRAVIQGQKDSLENLDKFFAEHKQKLDQKITDLEGKETTLGNEVRNLISANLSPSMTPSFNSRYGASEKSKQDEEGSALSSTKPSPFRSGSGF